MKAVEDIEAYHEQFPAEIASKLEVLRNVIHAAVPELEETISYGMPAFKKGKVLVYYAANKSHIGFYPTSQPIVAFAKELAPYKTSKGAIQFPYDAQLPVTLIQKIVRYRLKQEQEKLAAKRK